MIEIYVCRQCSTVTDKPNWSDFSSFAEVDDSGALRKLHYHIPICPRCGGRCATRFAHDTKEFTTMRDIANAMGVIGIIAALLYLTHLAWEKLL